MKGDENDGEKRQSEPLISLPARMRERVKVAVTRPILTARAYRLS